MEIKVSRQLFPFIYILKMSLDKQKNGQKKWILSIVESIHICLYKMHVRLNKLWSIEKCSKTKHQALQRESHIVPSWNFQLSIRGNIHTSCQR